MLSDLSGPTRATKSRRAAYAAMIIVAIGAVAFPFIAHVWFEGWPTNAEVVMSLCISAGTTLFLAVFVGVVEKRFEHVTAERVRSAAQETADQVQEGVSEQIQEATDNLAGRLTEVEKRLDEQVAEAIAQHDADRAQMFADLAQPQDSGRVGRALEDAIKLGTIQRAHGITIPLGSPTRTARITFRSVSASTVVLGVSGRHSLTDRWVETDQFTWRTGTDSVELFTRVSLETRKIGIDDVVSPERFCTTLAGALREITDSRTGRDGRWIPGDVVTEWLDSGWVITEDGLVSRRLGLCLRYVGPTGGSARIAGPTPEFARPPEVDEDFWKVAVDRTYATRPHLSDLDDIRSSRNAETENLA